jgi:hypothetical protein
MTDETPKGPDKPSAKDALSTAKNATETAKTLAETTGNAISAIKWVAIAVVAVAFFGTIFLGYKLVSAPAKAVGNAAGAVSDSVKSGASSVKEGTSEIINRLVIPAANQTLLDSASEAAFDVLNELPETLPEGMKERVFWKANFGGHENRVCTLFISFGGDPMPVVIAADNKAHLTAKSLGSDKDRLIRLMLRAPDDDIVMHVEWDETDRKWVSKWRATTVKKSLEDSIAAQRILDVLSLAATDCK